jgi:putative membrane protein
MKNFVASVAAMLMAVALPAFAATNNNSARSDEVSLLNKASQINQSEVDMANMLSNKAGDNIALSTLATTLKDDHEANESAVKSLADKQNITLKSYQPDDAVKNKLDNLKGVAFQRAFLEHEAMDHREALSVFQNARKLTDNREMKLYIDETIPVIRAHLEMVENVRRDLGSKHSNSTAADYRQSSSH